MGTPRKGRMSENKGDVGWIKGRVITVSTFLKVSFILSLE